MQVKEEDYDVGVIVGRFQVPELHDAHKELIEYVRSKHDKVLVLLGLSPLMNTKNNPLDFEARKQMLLDEWSDLNVLYIKDMFSDEVWSAQLDGIVNSITTAQQSVVLYGGRDSFIEHYKGKHPCRELVQKKFYSGNEVRKLIARASTKASRDFRAGVIWASQARFPTAFTCVDIAIFDQNYKNILLGRKEHEYKYRLIGGFSEPDSPSFEEDAQREVNEETGLTITTPQYVGSFHVPDWRYRNEVDQVKTLLFTGTVQSGKPKPADDIAEVKWFDFWSLKMTDVMPNHHRLIQALMSAFKDSAERG